MYIAVTGSEGAVGRIVVATAARQGHRIRRIDRVTATKQETIDQLPLEYVEANLSDYDSALQALRGCDAVSDSYRASPRLNAR